LLVAGCNAFGDAGAKVGDDVVEEGIKYGVEIKFGLVFAAEKALALDVDCSMAGAEKAHRVGRGGFDAVGVLRENPKSDARDVALWESGGVVSDLFGVDFNVIIANLQK
jgi:hypothetical protein